ncbi:MAG TPA: tetratricopeptide repeat protein [bacterium]|nr:tetratricopeptide repeat protein [bacterium]
MRFAPPFLGCLSIAMFLGSCAPKTLVRPDPPPVVETDGTALWEEVLRKDPWRLDARFRLADLYGEKGRFTHAYDLWVQTLQMEDRYPVRFRWEKGPPPQPPSHLITDRLQEAIDRELGLENEEATERALRLAKLGATYFPTRRSFERGRAVCYARRGDLKAALKCLLRLLRKDPKDPATLLTLGEVLEKTGKRKEAGIYYREAAGFSGPEAETARERLQGF